MSEQLSEEDMFKSNCFEFSELAKKIKFHGDQKKELMARQKELKEPIAKFMKTNEADSIEIKGVDNPIKYTETRRVKPLNKDLMTKGLMNYFEENMNDFNMLDVREKAEALTKWIYDKDNRIYNTVENVSMKV